MPRAHAELASRSEAGRPTPPNVFSDYWRAAIECDVLSAPLAHASTSFVLNSLQRSEYLGDDLIVIFVQPL